MLWTFGLHPAFCYIINKALINNLAFYLYIYQHVFPGSMLSWSKVTFILNFGDSFLKNRPSSKL